MKFLSIKSNVDRLFFLSVFFFSVGDMLYINKLYIPAEILRLSSSMYLMFVLFKNYQLMRNPKCLPYNLLVFWIGIVTLISCLSSGRNSIWGETITETIANIFLGYQFMPSIIPIVVLMFTKNREVDIYFFKKLSIILVCVYLLFYPMAFYNMYTFDWNMNSKLDAEDSYMAFVTYSTMGIRHLFPPVIMLFWKKYLSKMEWRLVLLACIADFAMSLFMARRGQSFMSVLYFISCWLLYFFYDKKRSKLFYILPFLLLVPAFFYLYSYLSDSFLMTIIERGFEDSRTAVEESFYKDVTGIDAIVGRGWFGMYYESVFGEYRREMESGYLALVLRGGWIYLTLYVCVLLFSAYKGLFKSKSIFVKSFAILILLHIIDLYPWGLPRFSFQYISVWVGVYICLFMPYRRMSETEVDVLCFNKHS